MCEVNATRCASEVYTERKVSLGCQRKSGKEMQLFAELEGGKGLNQGCIVRKELPKDLFYHIVVSEASTPPTPPLGGQQSFHYPRQNT